jgi:hypothetical protein
MKKTIVLVVSMMLVAGAIALPAQAKKKKKSVAVETTFHFHGAQPVGEAESDPAVNNTMYLPMDAAAPDGAEPKSKQITNGLVTPNTECAGNQLYPIWVGKVSGRIVGDVKVSLNTVSTPGGQVDVRIWPDINSSLCTSELAGTTDYPKPAAEKTIDLPPGPGTTEVDLGTVDFPAIGSFMIQISPTPLVDAGPQKVLSPFAGRVLYDSTSFDSTITFSCVPKTGTSCAP